PRSRKIATRQERQLPTGQESHAAEKRDPNKRSEPSGRRPAHPHHPATPHHRARRIRRAAGRRMRSHGRFSRPCVTLTARVRSPRPSRRSVGDRSQLVQPAPAETVSPRGQSSSPGRTECFVKAERDPRCAVACPADVLQPCKTFGLEPEGEISVSLSRRCDLECPLGLGGVSSRGISAECASAMPDLQRRARHLRPVKDLPRTRSLPHHPRSPSTSLLLKGR